MNDMRKIKKYIVLFCCLMASGFSNFNYSSAMKNKIVQKGSAEDRKCINYLKTTLDYNNLLICKKIKEVYLIRKYQKNQKTLTTEQSTFWKKQEKNYEDVYAKKFEECYEELEKNDCLPNEDYEVKKKSDLVIKDNSKNIGANDRLFLDIGEEWRKQEIIPMFKRLKNNIETLKTLICHYYISGNIEYQMKSAQQICKNMKNEANSTMPIENKRKMSLRSSSRKRKRGESD